MSGQSVSGVSSGGSTSDVRYFIMKAMTDSLLDASYASLLWPVVDHTALKLKAAAKVSTRCIHCQNRRNPLPPSPPLSIFS